MVSEKGKRCLSIDNSYMSFRMELQLEFCRPPLLRPRAFSSPKPASNHPSGEPANPPRFIGPVNMPNSQPQHWVFGKLFEKDSVARAGLELDRPTYKRLSNLQPSIPYCQRQHGLGACCRMQTLSLQVRGVWGLTGPFQERLVPKS